ncbi:hypothetical protein ACF06M_07650 [Streptomyces sp. NPDC015238]|uniref:hypothetical protein n=1 Tax=unclassified Streptomyces TaxID=2593676 RepID=UPI0036FDDAC6
MDNTLDTLDFELDVQEIPDAAKFDPAEMCSDSAAYSLCCWVTISPTMTYSELAMCGTCC